MSGNRIINVQAGGIYNEHVDKQIFFQGTVNVQTPGGMPPQEQYMKSVDAICAEPEEVLTEYPESPLDATLFNEALDLPRVKQALGALIDEKRRRDGLRIAHWFIVWKFFRRYNFIPRKPTQAKFIQWAATVFGWSWKAKDFKGSNVPMGVKDTPLDEWTVENLSAQRPQSEEYIDWRNALMDAFLTVGRSGRMDCKESLCIHWFDTNLG